LNVNRVPITFSLAIYFITFIIGALSFYFLNPDLSNLEAFCPNCDFQVKLTTLAIMRNNGIMIAILISGFFSLGFTTFTNLVLNGFTFGTAIASIVQASSPLTTILLIIMPHAIFELPAIWIAGAAGFKIPYELVRYFTEKKDYILNRQEIIDFLVLTGCAVVLIIIAAIIEANVTKRIAETVNHL
jgi:stage II sporulation protein M